MRINDDTVLDDAVALLEDHSWRTRVPCLEREHVAELVAVLAPLFQRSRPKVQAAKRERAKQQKLPSRPVRVSSSNVPKTLRDAVLKRDDHSCQRCGVSLYGRRYSLQHRDARGAGGSRRLHTMANLVALCGTGTTECHGHVESEPIESDRLGWSVPNGVKPEQWPVYRWTPDGPQWMQPGSTWVPASPHPRQTEGKVA